MARTEARLKQHVWRGLHGTTPHAKLLYTVLLTESTLNHAGVGAIRPDKWSRNAELSMDDTEAAVRELHAKQYVILDEETGEFLVRTLIRNDDIADQPYLLKGALKEALHTESALLRRVLAAELRKLPPKRPDGVGKNGRLVVYPDPHAVADQLDSGPPPGSGGQPVETLSSGSPNGQDAPPVAPSQEGIETLSRAVGAETLSTASPMPSETLRGWGGGWGRGRGYVRNNSSSKIKTLALAPLGDHDTAQALGDDRDQLGLIVLEPPPTPAVVPINRKTDETFKRFYAAYPRKKAPQRARKAWDKAIKTTDPEIIITAAQRLADSKPVLQYTPYPATWLNDGAWEDQTERRYTGHIGYQQPADANYDGKLLS